VAVASIKYAFVGEFEGLMLFLETKEGVLREGMKTKIGTATVTVSHMEQNGVILQEVSAGQKILASVEVVPARQRSFFGRIFSVFLDRALCAKARGKPLTFS
jgi:hypothetical protein